MTLLETTQLIKTYNGRRVVNEVTFALQEQEIIGLLGRNGAGKTTTFRMILGMVVPDSGAVAFLGQDITHLPMYKRARRGIGYLSQERSDFRRLTVWQNLQAILETRSEINRAERNRRAERLLAQYGLTRQRNQRADTLSGGERRKLEIARALVTDPRLILLDEPFSGVDPIAVEDLQREVIRLKEEFGKSVLITDHNVAQTLKVCDRALIIEDGQVKFEGTPREVINDPGVRAAYTGNLFRGDEFDDPSSPPPPAPPAPPVRVVTAVPARPVAKPSAAPRPATAPAANGAPAARPTVGPVGPNGAVGPAKVPATVKPPAAKPPMAKPPTAKPPVAKPPVKVPPKAAAPVTPASAAGPAGQRVIRPPS